MKNYKRGQKIKIIDFASVVYNNEYVLQDKEVTVLCDMIFQDKGKEIIICELNGQVMKIPLSQIPSGRILALLEKKNAINVQIKELEEQKHSINDQINTLKELG